MVSDKAVGCEQAMFKIPINTNASCCDLDQMFESMMSTNHYEDSS